MLCLTQSFANDCFKCGNQTLSQLNFQLSNSQGDLVNVSNHWSCSIVVMKAHD